MKTTVKPQEKQTRPESKEKIPGDKNAKTEMDNNLRKEEMQEKNDKDTAAPDEFIAPTADTDQPLDDGIVNDATLRGEDHRDDTIENLEAKLRNSGLGKREKKNEEKS